MADYVLDNAWQRARERLAALAEMSDPGTLRHRDALGVTEEWRCLEVGAGDGSIAQWLCERVGARGSVLATDIDPRFWEALDAPNLETRRHNIVTDDLPMGTFGLVHARNLLTHLPERRTALARMVAALQPGGWLLVEEPDFVSRVPDPATADAALVERCERAWQQHVRSRGMDPAYGRRLYGDVRAHGLVEIAAEGRVVMIHGGASGARVQQLAFTQMREDILGTGIVTEQDMDRFLAMHDDLDAAWMGPTTMAVWGRRPTVQDQ